MKLQGDITKTDDDKRLVFGWASQITNADGTPMVDSEGDVIADEWELEKAAYDFVTNHRVAGEVHQRDGGKPVVVGECVESFVLTKAKRDALGLPDTMPLGWWVGFKVTDDNVWKAVKDGTYSSFSIGGRAIRVPVTTDEEEIAYTKADLTASALGRFRSAMAVRNIKHGRR